MMEICGDNRFEIIAKAKEHLLDATNIDTSEDEMKVLDSFLFRCWQMGWLDRYDRKDEPTISKMEQVDEPQTSGVVWTDNEMPIYHSTTASADEPQTDCPWK